MSDPGAALEQALSQFQGELGKKLARFAEVMQGSTQQEVSDNLSDLGQRGSVDAVRLNALLQECLELQKFGLQCQQLMQSAMHGNEGAARQLEALMPSYVTMIADWIRVIGGIVDCLEPLVKELEALWETCDGRRMRKKTAEKWRQLKALLRAKGYTVQITSTNTGDHVDVRHRLGKAIDFVATLNGQGLTPAQSQALEAICRAAGWGTFNEYIKDSPKKTGAHMHVSL